MLKSVVFVQNRFAALLGCTPEARAAVVAGMLRRDPREATSYWLQLVVSVGIATLGLVLGSSAVVIGAMLVAPLMGPIVGLGMGLATGSPFLVLRSASRVGWSVVTAVSCSALLTRSLPFHELNAEIAARTSPTALDLLTAAFCALAGVYAAMRPGSDTATTAAGTSIGISLVPPLCASGFGLGTRAWPVSSGAAMLFLTNVVAIVLVATLAFLSAGFNLVHVGDLERDEIATSDATPIARALSRRLSWVFASRAGILARVLMPFVLLGAVYVPLRRALNEVAWEVRARQGAGAAIGRIGLPVVQSRVRIERHAIEIAIVVVGGTADAARARSRLEGDIRAEAGVVPHIELLAVPDAEAFAGLESTLRLPPPVVEPPPPPPDPRERLAESRAYARAIVASSWPRGAAGEPIEVSLSVSLGRMRIDVLHEGQALDAPAREAIGLSLARELGGAVVVVDTAFDSEEHVRRDDPSFLLELGRACELVAGREGLSLCVRGPSARLWGAEKAFAEAVRASLARRAHVRVSAGGEWSMRVVRGECPLEPTSTALANARGDGAP